MRSFITKKRLFRLLVLAQLAAAAVWFALACRLPEPITIRGSELEDLSGQAVAAGDALTLTDSDFTGTFACTPPLALPKGSYRVTVEYACT